MHSTTASSSSSSSSSLDTSASADDMPAALPINRPDNSLRSRLLSQQALSSSSTATAAAPSFRVYYSLAPGSVPFLWEASPGTPKHSAAGADDHPPSSYTASAIPPLTPPPSYLSSPKTPLGSTRRRNRHYHKAVRLLAAFLPRSASFSSRSRMPSSSPSSAWFSQTVLSSSSSSSSARDSPRTACVACYHGDDEDSDVDGEPVTPPKPSALCFQAVASRPFCGKTSAGSR